MSSGVIGYAYYSVCMHVSGLLRHNLDFYELGFGRISDLDLLGEPKKLVCKLICTRICKLCFILVN